MKSLKIKYINPYNSFPFSSLKFLNFLSKDYKVEEVNEKEDLIIEHIHKKLSKDSLCANKTLLIGGENLYQKINLFKLLDYISKKTKITFIKLKNILPKRILNLKLGLMRSKYYKYIKNIAKNPKKRKYAIISNDIKGKNLFNLPYFLQTNHINNDLEKIKTKNLIKKVPKKFCCIIISNESAFDRINFTKKLSKYKKVDIYGKTSLTNSDNSKLPKSWAENSGFYSQYKFVICFENSFANEYITEKLPNVMLGNSIPIYRGAPNVKNYFNTRSFINYEDYDSSYDKMINKIIELDKDDKKYLEFMKIPWLTEKNKKNITNKQKELKQFLKRVIEG